MDEPDKKRKGMSKAVKWTAIIVGGIIVLLIIVGISSNSGSLSVNQSGVAQTCYTFEALNAPTIPYAELEKDPDSYQSRGATFTGQVVQIEQSANGGGYIRLAVDKDSLGIWNVSDVILLEYQGNTNAVENDVISVAGVMEGSQTYTSEANYQITVPLMYACSIIDTTQENAGAANSSVNSPAPTPQPAPTPTPTPTPTPSPTPTPQVQPTPKPTTTASWHTAYTYNNSAGIQTPPFTLQGQEQKITYSCTVADNTNPYSIFDGIIESTSDSGNSDTFAESVNCPSSNSTYEYDLGPGQYYLSLDDDNAIYNITVQDYY